MYEAKLASKNQIVVPKPARQALGLKAGDKLLVVVRSDTVILLQNPRNTLSPRRELLRVPTRRGICTGKGQVGLSAEPTA